MAGREKSRAPGLSRDPAFSDGSGWPGACLQSAVTSMCCQMRGLWVPSMDSPFRPGRLTWPEEATGPRTAELTTRAWASVWKDGCCAAARIVVEYRRAANEQLTHLGTQQEQRLADARLGASLPGHAGGMKMSASETTRVTLMLPTDIYQEITSAKERQETRSVAGFIREAVEEKVARMRWRRNLDDLRREIREAGGLELQGNKEEIIERLRETRREIFEAEYAHLYR